VRHLRRLHASGKLEQWKVDRLNLLGFEWSLGDQAAKWLSKYHDLRRFRAVYGHLELQGSHSISEGSSRGNIGSTHPELQRWLQRQAVLYAKGALTEQQVALLARLGVELRVEADRAERAVREQVCTRRMQAMYTAASNVADPGCQLCCLVLLSLCESAGSERP
jgi:hypothetical protein